MTDKQNLAKSPPAVETSRTRVSEYDSLLARLRRGALEALVLRAISLGLLFTMFTLISRHIGVGQFGTFSYVYMLASTLAFIAPLGWPNAAMRFMREYLEQHDWSLLRGMLIRAHQVTLVTSLVVSITLVGLSTFVIRDSLTMSFRYAALILPLLALIHLRRKIFQALDQTKASLFLQDVLPPVLVLLSLILFSMNSASKAVFTYFLALLLSFALASVWLKRSVPAPAQDCRPAWRMHLWFSVAWPMLLGGISSVLVHRTDIVMLGLLTNMEVVGQYSAANQLATLNVFVIVAVNAVTAPQLASAYQQRDIDRFQSLLRVSRIWATLGALPPFFVMILFPQQLLTVFGDGFTTAAPLLIVLSSGQLFNAMAGSSDYALLMSDGQKNFAISSITVAVVNVSGNFIAIPYIGALGASLVTAISLALLSVWQLLLTRHITPSQIGVN